MTFIFFHGMQLLTHGPNSTLVYLERCCCMDEYIPRIRMVIIDLPTEIQSSSPSAAYVRQLSSHHWFR